MSHKKGKGGRRWEDVGKRKKQANVVICGMWEKAGKSRKKLVNVKVRMQEKAGQSALTGGRKKLVNVVIKQKNNNEPLLKSTRPYIFHAKDLHSCVAFPCR